MNSLRFILPEDTVGGTLLENGTWTGVMGLINNDKVDFAANYFVFTTDRLTISEIAYPSFVANQLAILSTIKNQHSYLDFFKAFTPSLWLFILLSFIIFIFCFTIENYRVSKDKYSTVLNFTNIIAKIITDLFLVLINQGKIISNNYSNHKLEKILIKPYKHTVTLQCSFVRCMIQCAIDIVNFLDQDYSNNNLDYFG